MTPSGESDMRYRISVRDDNGVFIGEPVVIDLSQFSRWSTSHRPTDPDDPLKYIPGVRVEIEKVGDVA